MRLWGVNYYRSSAQCLWAIPQMAGQSRASESHAVLPQQIWQGQFHQKQRFQPRTWRLLQDEVRLRCGGFAQGIQVLWSSSGLAGAGLWQAVELGLRVSEREIHKMLQLGEHKGHFKWVYLITIWVEGDVSVNGVEAVIPWKGYICVKVMFVNCVRCLSRLNWLSRQL